MKKMLSVVLSALFVLGFAATVSANSAVQCAQPPIVAVDFQPPAGDQQPQQPTDHKKKKKQPGHHGQQQQPEQPQQPGQPQP